MPTADGLLLANHEERRGRICKEVSQLSGTSQFDPYPSTRLAQHGHPMALSHLGARFGGASQPAITRTPCDKRSASKRLLSPDSNRWQGLDGPHQWKMAEALFCLEREILWLTTFSQLSVYVFFFFLFDLFPFIPPSDYVTRKVVTCFHECAMKRYEILSIML